MPTTPITEENLDDDSPLKNPSGVGIVGLRNLSNDNKGTNIAVSANFCEWVYEFFQNRYGLKNVGDKKFS